RGGTPPLEGSAGSDRFFRRWARCGGRWRADAVRVPRAIAAISQSRAAKTALGAVRSQFLLPLQQSRRWPEGARVGRHDGIGGEPSKPATAILPWRGPQSVRCRPCPDAPAGCAVLQDGAGAVRGRALLRNGFGKPLPRQLRVGSKEYEDTLGLLGIAATPSDHRQYAERMPGGRSSLVDLRGLGRCLLALRMAASASGVLSRPQRRVDRQARTRVRLDRPRGRLDHARAQDTSPCARASRDRALRRALAAGSRNAR